MKIQEEMLLTVMENFNLLGTCIAIKANTEGHINATFISTYQDGSTIRKYTHQRINDSVFSKPLDVMENIEAVTNHVRGKIQDTYDDVDRRCLRVIRTKDGKLAYCDSEGKYWRTYLYIDQAKTYSTITDPQQAFLFGEAIGTFQMQLSDFNGATLHETIPSFHSMALRYDQLLHASSTNLVGRLSLAKTEFSYLMDQRERAMKFWKVIEQGEVPVRVTHNDTKMNNVLFNLEETEALCVIDLDTVMPGSLLFDTGDMIRTATITAAEDEIDLGKVRCNGELHRSLLQGYISKATFLTDLERSLLVESGRYITQIMAVRFLTDFLQGDTYYAIHRENHNIDRTRTQIRLMQDMDAQWDSLAEEL